MLDTINTFDQKARESLFERYRDRVEVNPTLNRSLVSYQSNRKRPFYRWFKYKEGFSAALVEYVIDHLGLCNGGRLLDPFAGTGAALMLGLEKQLDGIGIELLPIGIKAVDARRVAESVDSRRLASKFKAVCDGYLKTPPDKKFAFPHLRITEGAFAAETERQLNRFRTYLATANLQPEISTLAELACLGILESISFTRKDGQYLRWDHRAPRDLKGKRFDKGAIAAFDDALQCQLRMMVEDLTTPDLFSHNRVKTRGELQMLQGSCLELLPTIPDSYVDLVITSPPYCNRYDYTRTYALELAYLGVDEDRLKQLRQSLLSCTVENRCKTQELRDQYAALGCSSLLSDATDAFDNQDALQEVLKILDHLGKQRRLNNTNVPRMVRNYFLESAVVIFELSRIVKSGGYVVMVNDNVQYGGEEVPVDLILSDLASKAGFETERIWMLPRGKGNSSQQMGKHGRNELRKCVYIWRR